MCKGRNYLSTEIIDNFTGVWEFPNSSEKKPIKIAQNESKTVNFVPTYYFKVKFPILTKMVSFGNCVFPIRQSIYMNIFANIKIF